MSEPSEAYVTGLLADLEPLVPRLEAELAEARRRAARIDAELSALLGRIDASRRALGGHERAAEEAAAAVAKHNGRMAALHQETAALQRRAADFKTEMERVGEGAVFARLRRERARVLVQVEDRQKEIAAHQTAVAEARSALGAAEAGIEVERDRARDLRSELDRLQTQLPGPQLYLRLFEARAARAHCRHFLDRQGGPWEAELRAAIELVAELHRALRAGKYRLDEHSDVVGGRAMASAEAMYGAAALGDVALVRELFASIADPALMFDQIFNVFRVWCLGLHATGDAAGLGRLLRKHRFSPGLKGGYVEAFTGLAERDPGRVGAGLKTIARYEWEVWQDPKLVRGAGVVSLGATGLARLALDAGLAVTLPGPTVPDGLLVRPRGGPPAISHRA